MVFELLQNYDALAAVSHRKFQKQKKHLKNLMCNKSIRQTFLKPEQIILLDYSLQMKYAVAQFIVVILAPAVQVKTDHKK